jgi:hypothetical protein
MTTFTPLTSEFDVTPSTVDTSGNPMPAGETLSGITLGIRPDGGAPGAYPNLVVVPSPFTVESKTALLAVLGANFPTGNYWIAGKQTDVQNGQTFTSDWGTEVPFALLPPGVAPAAPVVSVK